MRVLITGAGGTLGRALAPLLAGAGHDPVLMDVRPVDAAHEFRPGDVRNLEDARAAIHGTDYVVHAAAIHGIHLASRSARDFHDLNLTGTFNVLEAVAAEGARGVVFCSTMGVYGRSRRPSGEQDVVALGEDTPLQPDDVYALTKVAGEELCRYHLRAHGLRSIALRFGMFVPEPFFREGIRLLYGGVDAHDVARSVLAALDALERGGVEWDAFNVESVVPFGPEDGPQLRHDPLPVLDRYYPGAGELLRDRGVERLAPLREYFPVGRAAERLGWRPERSFAQWLGELAARPEERAPNSPPWP